MTKFIEEFDRRISVKDFDVWFEDKLYESYLFDEMQNKHWLIQKFFEYNKKEWDIKYYILVFIKFLWEKDRFFDEDVVELLKDYINQYLAKKVWDFDFFTMSLRTLYRINTKDICFFMKIFDLTIDSIWPNSYILSIFLRIFINSKLSDCFFKCAVLMLKSERRSFYEFEIWKYLIDLSEIEFKKYFIELLKLFTEAREKEQLIDLGRYVWLVNFVEKKWKYLEYELENKKIIDNLLKRIRNISFSKLEIKTIEKFLFSEINFISNKYQDVEKSYFNKNLFSILNKKDVDLLYNCIKQSDLSSFSFSNPEFICNNLGKNNIWKCIGLYKDYPNYFFRIYQLIKYNKRKDLISILKENKKFYDSLIAIEKQSKKEQQKWQKEELNKKNERKKWILELTKIKDEKTFSPRLLQFYYNSMEHEDDFNVFTVTERKKLDKYTQKHAMICLNSAQIEGYNDEKIKNIVIYEETWEQSHSIGRYVHYLYRILNISEYLNFDISDFYKSFVLIYPLIFWDEAQNRLLAFYEWKIKKSDIDYILRAYSEDLHENAIWLKFYNPNWLCKFYEKFKKYFLPKQKEKIKNILLDFIESEKIRYKDEFIETYAETVNKESFIKIYNEPTINYFKSILSNEIPIPEDKKIDLDKQLKINELLITKFHDKNAMLWRIEQIKKWVVKFKNPNTLQPWQFIGVVHAVSALEDELEFWHDNERSFCHVIEIKSPINIKEKMLELFELWLKLQQDIKRWDIDSDYKSYSSYLIRVFYWYVNNLESKKRYYYKVIKLLDKYPNNDLNISILNKYFWIDTNSHTESLNKSKMSIYNQISKINILKDKESLLKKNIAYLEDEEQKAKSRINAFKNIVIVEWETDKIILENAREKLYPWKYHNFIITYAKGCKILAPLLNDIAEWRQNWFLKWNLTNINKIIWIFDFDNEWYLAYNSMLWDYFKENNHYTEELGLSKIYNNISAIIIPIPSDKHCFANKKLGNHSMVEIENLFGNEVFDKYISSRWINLNTWNKFKLHEFPGNTALYQIWNDKNNKENFAKFTAELNAKDFQNFEPLFDQIKNIIKREKNN